MSEGSERPPPRRTRLPLKELWPALPETTRQKTVQTLARIVARLAFPPCRKEVTHESR